MNFNDYQSAALATAKPLGTTAQLIHASLGLTTEVGEFVSEVKRIAIYGKPLDKERVEQMSEEIGDIMWYLAVACDTLGISMHQAARENIAKLQKRFPEAYSDVAAEARADKGGLSHRES